MGRLKKSSLAVKAREAIADVNKAEQIQYREQLLPEAHQKTGNNSNKYTEEFKMLAVIYYAMGMTYDNIAGKLGISKGTVHNWVHDYQQSVEVRGVVEQIVESLPSRANLTVSRLISSISDEKIEKASLRDTAFAAKVLYETSRLSENKSTANISIITKNATEAQNSLSFYDQQISDLQSYVDDLPVDGTSTIIDP